MKNLEDYQIGEIINVSADSVEGLYLSRQFNKFLFEYFEGVQSGMIGWGISFIEWIEMFKGWGHHGMNMFKKIR